jgi:hypothetical protein
MNGAILDSTFNIFFKLKFEKLYDAILATPMRVVDVARGEITWALLRGGVYSAGFLGVMLAMGLIQSWWALLALPATLLIGYAFAGVGMALTTFMRTWQDFEYVQLAIMPMFLFSATFFPVDAFEGPLRWVVEATPLYRGVVTSTTGSAPRWPLWRCMWRQPGTWPRRTPPRRRRSSTASCPGSTRPLRTSGPSCTSSGRRCSTSSGSAPRSARWR